MKKLTLNFITLLLFTISTSISYAVNWEIHDPCSDRILHKGSTLVNFPYPSLGKFTVERLTENKIPFVGSEEGIGSIYKTPQGDDSLVIKNNQEMYAYGWCYHLNGDESVFMPSQVELKNNSDHVKWFFAFATYKSGVWVSMCTPAWKQPLVAYCGR